MEPWRNERPGIDSLSRHYGLRLRGSIFVQAYDALCGNILDLLFPSVAHSFGCLNSRLMREPHAFDFLLAGMLHERQGALGSVPARGLACASKPPGRRPARHGVCN